MYRIRESLEKIRIESKKMDEENRTRDLESNNVDLYIDSVLTRLEASVTSACTALDAFYAAS